MRVYKNSKQEKNKKGVEGSNIHSSHGRFDSGGLPHVVLSRKRKRGKSYSKSRRGEREREGWCCVMLCFSSLEVLSFASWEALAV